MRYVLPLCLVTLTLGVMLFLSAPERPDAIEWSGPARVSDGDSLRIGDQRIRLYGIDAPERGQTCRHADGTVFACGDHVTEVLRDRLRGHDLRCTHIEYDRYDRSVAQCFVGEADIARELVAAGYARAYLRYSRDYEGIERTARDAERGIWAGEMQAPDAFRREH